ncbi:hypothetical protein D3C72_1135560 [compost metagenome]
MADRAQARRCPAHRARFGAGLADHVGKALAAEAGGGHHQHRRVHHAHHRRHVLLRVVVDVADMRVQRQRAGRGEAERIAVRRGLGDGVDADAAAGAGLVLDHHRSAHLHGQLLAQRTGHGIADAAGRVGHDHADRAARVGVRGMGGGNEGRGRKRGDGEDGQGRQQRLGNGRNHGGDGAGGLLMDRRYLSRTAPAAEPPACRSIPSGPSNQRGEAVSAHERVFRHPRNEQFVGAVVQPPRRTALAAGEGQHAERHAGRAGADVGRRVAQGQAGVRLAAARVLGQGQTMGAGGAGGYRQGRGGWHGGMTGKRGHGGLHARHDAAKRRRWPHLAVLGRRLGYVAPCLLRARDRLAFSRGIAFGALYAAAPCAQDFRSHIAITRNLTACHPFVAPASLPCAPSRSRWHSPPPAPPPPTPPRWSRPTSWPSRRSPR